jgi:hypothetical protein
MMIENNEAQQDQDRCEQAVFQISDHRPEEEHRGGQKYKNSTPGIPLGYWSETAFWKHYFRDAGAGHRAEMSAAR